MEVIRMASDLATIILFLLGHVPASPYTQTIGTENWKYDWFSACIQKTVMISRLLQLNH